ncbi:hypothetical protein [Entomomonas asaccharolytica]|uniref:Uncharacterized protein n=1 Tax=Entomomonas asaccharolytica TaxID=2785331 RepID=A0A974RY42_9GAMM|nr:hypothetical protein [Entomomonas asaccharolytica]QQP86898.1 hypothetical protein JHT90_06550 [Entomomonas asaccharolytica]
MIKVSIDYLATLGSKYLLRVIDEKLPNYIDDPIDRYALLSLYSMIDKGMDDEAFKEVISLLKKILGNELEVKEELIE